MTDKIRLVRGDTEPQVRIALTDEVTNNPTNLTGCTVTLHMRSVDTGLFVFSRPATINPANASTGVCYIVWEEGDLDQEPGNYDGEVEVVRADGSVETIYDLLKFKIREAIA